MYFPVQSVPLPCCVQIIEIILHFSKAEDQIWLSSLKCFLLHVSDQVVSVPNPNQNLVI